MYETSTILADKAAQFLTDNPTVTNTDTLLAAFSGIARRKRLPEDNVFYSVGTGCPMRFDEAVKVMHNGPLLSDHLGADFVRLHTACKNWAWTPSSAKLIRLNTSGSCHQNRRITASRLLREDSQS
ncbi:MAG: hypothetical protein ACKVG0_11760 [Alphaproteobacteria bacterium]